jgi:hypothetical protein
MITTPGPMIIQTLGGLRNLWLAVGDLTLLRLYLIYAAGAWVDLDALDRADALLAEADALPESAIRSLNAVGALVRAATALTAGRADVVDEQLDAAEADYHDSGHEMGLFLVSFSRANVRLARGDALGAAADLDALRAHALARRHPELAIRLLVSRLSAAIAASDSPAMERLLSEYEASRHRHHSATRELQVDQAVAAFHDARADWARAEPAYRRVIASCGEIAGMWVEPAERAEFVERRSALLDKARQCFENLGKPEEAEQLIALKFPKDPVPVSAERDRLWRRLGSWVRFANLAVGFGAVMLSLSGESEYNVPFFVLVLILSPFTISGLILLVFDLTVGRLVPRLHFRHAGRLILMLASLPWLIAVLAPVALLIGFLLGP